MELTQAMFETCDGEFPQELNCELFTEFPFELSNFQKWAIYKMIEGHNTVLTAYTGSGKTVAAEAAILHYVKQGKRVIYCSPIKALSNEKCNSWKNKFPSISFGLITGDNKDNPEADVLIMTTECLQNQLLHRNENVELLDFKMDYEKECGTVIFDELHYLFTDRGDAWNDSIVKLPNNIPVIGLSATLSNPETLCNWISNVTERKTALCPNYKRIVPLEHYGLLFLNNHSNIKQFSPQEKEFIDDILEKQTLPIKMQQEYYEENVHKIARFKKILKKYNIYMKKEFVINEVAKYLKIKEELPAIIYVYSRAGCYKLADSIKQSLFPDGSNAVHTIKKEAISILQKKLSNWQEYTETIEFFKIVKRLEKGVAVHHSGVLQVYKEMIEILFADKKIPLLISTETFAVGLNMPVKTCVFTAFQKYSDKGFRNLTSSEYTQAAGRAGRRGLDKKGKNYHLVNLFRFGNDHLTPINYGHIVNGGYVSQQSKLEINYSYVLKQLYNKNNIQKHVMSSYGMSGKMLDNELERIDDMKEKLTHDKFIEDGKIVGEKELTEKGKIAICLQEIPCLAMADFIIRQEKSIEKLTAQDFAVIFSIFTSIRLPEEDKVYSFNDINITDQTKLMLKKITGTLRYWKDIEINAFNNVDHYDIQYDICELVNKWCLCKNQNDCNAVFKELRYWGIFLGDFIKAILKINTIANEIEKAAILLENLSLVQKMREIPQLTLKSIMTNKSLYL